MVIGALNGEGGTRIVRIRAGWQAGEAAARAGLRGRGAGRHLEYESRLL